MGRIFASPRVACSVAAGPRRPDRFPYRCGQPGARSRLAARLCRSARIRQRRAHRIPCSAMAPGNRLSRAPISRAGRLFGPARRRSRPPTAAAPVYSQQPPGTAARAPQATRVCPSPTSKRRRNSQSRRLRRHPAGEPFRKCKPGASRPAICRVGVARTAPRLAISAGGLSDSGRAAGATRSSVHRFGRDAAGSCSFSRRRRIIGRRPAQQPCSRAAQSCCIGAAATGPRTILDQLSGGGRFPSRRVSAARPVSAAAGPPAACVRIHNATAAGLCGYQTPAYAPSTYGDMAQQQPVDPRYRASGRRISRRRKAGHDHCRYPAFLSVSGVGRGQGAALRHRRRPSGLHLGGREGAFRPCANGRIGVRRTKCWRAGPTCRTTCPAARTIRSARARSISARRSIASTAPTSLGRSARRCRPAASACATTTSSTSTGA